jgi:hypothetical protein
MEKSNKGLSFDKEDTLEIAKTHNGYALKTYFMDTDGEGNDILLSDIELFERGEEENSDRECLKKLLYAVATALGFDYDKWKDNNLSIEFNKKGNKAE